MAFERIKGSQWFPHVKDSHCFVYGCGGIGSWVALNLARIGCSLSLYDMDEYDQTNLTGQFTNYSSIGKNKAVALKETLEQFCEDVSIDTFGEVTEDSEDHHIIFSCFDNMKARKIAFDKWFNFIKNNPEIREEAIFIDGRLTPNNYEIFVIKADLDQINRYAQEHLFDDSEVEELDCTDKQSTFMACRIASDMVSQYVNHRTVIGTGKKLAKTDKHISYIRISNNTIKQ